MYPEEKKKEKEKEMKFEDDSTTGETRRSFENVLRAQREGGIRQQNAPQARARYIEEKGEDPPGPRIAAMTQQQQLYERKIRAHHLRNLAQGERYNASLGEIYNRILRDQIRDIDREQLRATERQIAQRLSRQPQLEDPRDAQYRERLERLLQNSDEDGGFAKKQTKKKKRKKKRKTKKKKKKTKKRKKKQKKKN